MRSSRVGYRTRLYRKAVLGVIFVLLVVWSAVGQYAKKRQVSKGPRAVAVLELAENGRAHLLPVTIMIDGKFYDAGAYKAAPVPMALQPGTVYEAVKSGSPQGLFTVFGAISGKDSWVADGKWRSKADIEADKARAKAEAAKKAYKAPDELGGPPKLKRGANPGDQNSAGASSPPSGQTTPPQKPSSKTDSSSSSDASSQNSPSEKSAATAHSSGAPVGSVDAPDRPVLRHQAPSESTHEQTKSGNEDAPLKGPIQLIPAVSDADGPEPRPYTYQLKPEEEQNFLKKMLAIASADVRARAEHLLAEPETGTKARAKSARTAPAPEFQDVQLRIFDLTSSNEPVLVLTASASIPNAKLNLQYSTALVTREDIYGELHKVFAQTTDNQHLDVLPKYEFIDVVDADGDGRGELLFRTSSDTGSAFSIYAVIGDRLWPLFQGRPGT